MFLNVLFFASAILTVVSAIFVAVSKNIMHACMYLFGALVGVAGLYLTLGADFLSAVQVLVYVGGVIILMLFAIMLTGGREFMEMAKTGFLKDPYMGSKKTYAIGIFTSLVFILTFGGLVKNMMTKQNPEAVKPFTSTVEAIGTSLLTDHVLAFEISSVLLLGALIGAAIIARPGKEESQND